MFQVWLRDCIHYSRLRLSQNSGIRASTIADLHHQVAKMRKKMVKEAMRTRSMATIQVWSLSKMMTLNWFYNRSINRTKMIKIHETFNLRKTKKRLKLKKWKNTVVSGEKFSWKHLRVNIENFLIIVNKATEL